MKNLLSELGIDSTKDGKNLSIKGIMARVNKPKEKGGSIHIHFLVYSGEAPFRNQHSIMVNYTQNYNPKFLRELQDAQEKGYELEVRGVYTPINEGYMLGEIEAEKLSIFPRQDL